MPARRARDVDYLFVINGYLMEHKASFVRTLLEQARELPGYKVFVLGATDVDDTLYDPYRRDDLRIHPLAGGRLRQALFNRARVVISRAGYTTVMDLAEHDKRTSLVPTPNQTEQEYLAYHLSGQRYFESLRQGETFDLLSALRACERTRPFDPPWTTEESLRRLTERIDETLHRHFFSIVVPAHNEAAGLADTLRCLAAQRYPADRLEILSVENGSTDGSSTKPRRPFANLGPNSK